jgi:hypothetical protein
MQVGALKFPGRDAGRLVVSIYIYSNHNVIRDSALACGVGGPGCGRTPTEVRKWMILARTPGMQNTVNPLRAGPFCQ